jgi:heme a synthase
MNILRPSVLQVTPAVLIWLKSCLVLVLCMVAIGGLTRLTESGLSIVEWKLVSGIFPPLSDAGWQAEFEQYQATPEFAKKNATMALSDFKRIFWLEYLHRLLGRLIGLVFVIPLILFSIRRAAPKKWLLRFWCIFALICLQGAVGWYMVKSGLVHNPWVSPYRLAFHLSLATVILSCTYLSIKAVQGKCNGAQQGKAVLALMAVQIVWGAFVAGLDAGMIYNEFPLMGGEWMPDELFSTTPAWMSMFEHHATVQFMHRIGAFLVLGAVIWQAFKLQSRAAYMVLGVTALQITLGIATLLSVVNIWLASLHQLVAMGLVLAQLNLIIKSPHTIKSGITL